MEDFIGKRVVILQSNYIPWKGYFDLISKSDLCIFYDDVQFTKNDWRNRNKIKTDKGVVWISVPVGSSISRLVCDVKMVDPRWQRSHWDKIKQAYSKAPAFSYIESFLRDNYLESEWTYLSHLNQSLIKDISRNFLGISTEFKKSSEFSASGKGFERLLALLKEVDASEYITGPAGLNYFSPEDFDDHNIVLRVMNYSRYPEYTQVHPPFEHGVSIYDLLVHCGESSIKKFQSVQDWEK